MFSSPAASSLKRRTEAEQTPVSMLGKMLSTTREPARSFEVKSVRSPRRQGVRRRGAADRGELADGVDLGVAQVRGCHEECLAGRPRTRGNHSPPYDRAVPSPHRALLALPAALPLLAVLTACGGGSSSTTATEPATSAGSSASSSAAAGATTCDYTVTGQPSKKVTPPASTTDLTGDVKATIDTSVGTGGTWTRP